MVKIDPIIESFARIVVIGIGGSGKNAVNHMINSKVKGVGFICMNTDTQDLHHSLADKKIHIGKNLTRGLGAGMDPDVGKRAAEETKSEIQDIIKGADMVFLACGMGGGTGTGAAPIVAKIAKEQGILTVAVVTKPFLFEGSQRMKIAEKGIEDLSKEVDAIIIIPNDKLLQLQDKNITFKDAFATCDGILRQAVEGISDLITMPGVINIDFADIRSVMSNAGSALMGIGVASGEKRAEKAAIQAINSPLLETSINGAKGVLFAISGGDDLTMSEIQEAAKIVTESIDKDARVIFGTIRDEKMRKNELKVTVIATNFFNETPNNKTLFNSTTLPSLNLIPKEKEENPGLYARKEIPNTTNLTSNVIKNPTGINKKADREIEEMEMESETIIEDGDDWSAVPAFLRRNKSR
jgi:cell division protein FtsZ